MLVSNYISKDFIPPKINQKVDHAMDLVTNFQLTHVPIFEGLNFVGNLSRETLEEYDLSTDLSELADYAESFFIAENSSLFDAIQKFNNNNSNLLPVLNDNKHYMGCLMMDDVISGFSSMPLISEPGAVMTVSVAQKQFSVSEVSKIVESNNAKVIAVFVSAYQEDKVMVTVKLVADSLSSVGETFERFGYTVVHKFYNDEKEHLIKERFDLLMKYLET